MDNSKRKHLLYLGAFAALLPVLIFRDFTPSNELRYLSIADEALSNNTFFVFTNHGLPYADKPPLYLWAIMLCRWITGGHRMWLLALFSILPAFGIVHIMDRWTAQEIDEKNRSLARLMLLTCGLFVGVAVTLRMDMLMCFFIVLALRSFWRMFKNEGNYRQEARLFPIYLFFSHFHQRSVRPIHSILFDNCFPCRKQAYTGIFPLLGLAHLGGAYIFMCFLVPGRIY